MPQEIYNEGRVVGLSAWELFKNTAQGNGVPEADIPSEREWLASMIGCGASMVLKISSGTLPGIHDYALPANSSLSAAGVILANPFMGACDWDSSGWATKVVSYSPLILNIAGEGNSPSDDGSLVPYVDDYSGTQYNNQVSEFVKISDGIVFTKDATWIPTHDEESTNLPEKDINPNFNSSSTVVRLYINSTINTDIAVLFTGFTNKRILQGLSGYAVDNGEGVRVGGSTDTELDDNGIPRNRWNNGGMLGPEIIPWASKIVFSVPSSAYGAGSITRTIPSDEAYTGDRIANAYTLQNVTETVRTNSLIDLDSIVLTDYYNANSLLSATIRENVTDLALGINNTYNTLVAWYPGMTASQINVTKALSTDAEKKARFFPPALYGIQLTSTGTNQTLVPLDTAAPGTVKGFTDPTIASTYKQLLPNNYAIYYDSVNNTYSFVTNNVPQADWSGTAKLEYLSNIPDYPRAQVTVGSKKAKIITLTDANGNDYGNNSILDGSGGILGTTAPKTLTWDDLLKSLKTNYAVDVLGTKLRAFGNELDTNNTIGITNTITESGAGTFTLTGANSVSVTSDTSYNSTVAKLDNGTSIKVGTNFIEFANGQRLYITNVNPGTTNIPNGSVGIGW